MSPNVRFAYSPDPNRTSGVGAVQLTTRAGTYVGARPSSPWCNLPRLQQIEEAAGRPAVEEGVNGPEPETDASAMGHACGIREMITGRTKVRYELSELGVLRDEHQVLFRASQV
jgi:hypothetical protein